MMALSLATLRSAMGDFAILDPKYGFDIMDKHTHLSDNGDDQYVYRNSRFIVMFTFIIYILVAFFLFMIFMNFIIAVIS